MKEAIFYLGGPIYGKISKLNVITKKKEAVMRSFWLKKFLNENSIYLKNPKHKRGVIKKSSGVL